MNQPRDQWGSRLGFILAAAGSAIGLGNLWKFPYITFDNNGGAFVLVYLVCIAAVGLPIMIGEMMLGRKTQSSVVGAYGEAAGRPWKLVGGLGVLSGFVILGYYTVVAGWSLYYFAKCLGWSMNGYVAGTSSGSAFGEFVANAPLQLMLAAMFMLATVGVVIRGVGRGIEAVARVLLPILLVILGILMVSALTMSGAGEALRFILVPNFGEFEPAGALEALGHAFFTLSLGMGAMITYGSYMRRTDSIVSSALAVVILDTLIALVATVTMFSVIFSVPGLKDTVSKSPVGMLFITLPEQFYSVVPAGKILAPLFYVLVAFAALTSTISLLEVTTAYFIDERKMPRRAATITVGVLTFILSILCALSLGAVGGLSNFTTFAGKQGIFNLLDHLASNWFLPVGGFFLTLAVGWAISRRVSFEELVDEHTPSWFNYSVWLLFIRFVAPAAVGTIIGSVIFFGRDYS